MWRIQSSFCASSSPFPRPKPSRSSSGWLPANNQAFVGWKLDLNRPIQAILTGETDYMKALSDAETIFNTNNNR